MWKAFWHIVTTMFSSPRTAEEFQEELDQLASSLVAMGQQWVACPPSDGPWPREDARRYCALAVKDGWVRYADLETGDDLRMRAYKFVTSHQLVEVEAREIVTVREST